MYDLDLLGPGLSVPWPKLGLPLWPRRRRAVYLSTRPLRVVETFKLCLCPRPSIGLFHPAQLGLRA